MRRISSASTPFEKFLAPVLFPALLAFVAARLGAPLVWAMIAGLAACVGLFWMTWGLADAVYDSEDALVVRRRSAEVAIPFTEVRAVRENLWRRPWTLTVYLKQPLVIGDAVTFVPAFEPSILFGSSQVARDLRWRAGLANHR